MHIARSSGVAFTFENPAGSRLWLRPSIRDVLSWEGSSRIVTDYCQWGAAYKKPTGISGWG
eukprot:6091357-Alexandrium_andersonii.AAC.1